MFAWSDYRFCADYIVEIIWSSSWVLRNGSQNRSSKHLDHFWSIPHPTYLHTTHSSGLTNSTIWSRLYKLHKPDDLKLLISFEACHILLARWRLLIPRTLIHICDMTGHSLPTSAAHELKHFHITNAVYSMSLSLMHTCEITESALPTSAAHELKHFHVTNAVYSMSQSDA